MEFYGDILVFTTRMKGNMVATSNHVRANIV